jgi:hypothetical protein
VLAGVFDEVFRTGQPIPNASGLTQNLISYSTTHPTILNCDGRAVVVGTVTGQGVTYLTERTLFQEGENGDLVMVARALQPAPGAAVGQIFTSNSLVGKITCGDDGRFAFSAQLQGSGVTSGNDRGVWFVENGQAQLALREGMQIGQYIVREIVNNAASLQVSSDGSLVVRANIAPVSNPFGAATASVLSWSPCGGQQIVAALSQPLYVAGEQTANLANFWMSDTKALNDFGEFTMAVKFASSVSDDEAVVRIPISDCSNTCPADFDGNGSADVTDIFAFLSAWFAGNLDADSNENGSLGVDDIFAFLSVWFAGC